MYSQSFQFKAGVTAALILLGNFSQILQQMCCSVTVGVGSVKL